MLIKLIVHKNIVIIKANDVITIDNTNDILKDYNTFISIRFIVDVPS